MKNMHKNLVLFIIAGNKKGVDNKIIFSMFKEEYTISPRKNIKSFTVHKLFEYNEVEYKQYFFIGPQHIMENIFNDLIINSKMIVNGIVFTIPRNLTLLDDKKECSGGHFIKSYKDKENIFYDDIYFNSIRENFGAELETDNNGYPQKFFPFAFIKTQNIQNYISSSIIIVYKKILLQEIFRGIGNNKEIEEIIGYINVDGIENNKIEIKLDTGEKAQLNDKTGEYVIKLNKKNTSGKIIYTEKESQKIIYENNFNLITNVNINIKVLDSTLELLDGEKVNYSQKDIKDNNRLISEGKKIDVDVHKYFSSTTYGNSKNYLIVVTQYIEKILSACSPDILVFDPYLLGDVINMNEGQKIFINALYLSAINYKINSITFLGNKKSKKFISDYRNVLGNLQKIDKNIKIEFITIKESIHDRGIVKIDNYNMANRRIFLIGSSINGWFSSKDLNISEIFENSMNTLYSLLQERCKNGESNGL